MQAKTKVFKVQRFFGYTKAVWRWSWFIEPLTRGWVYLLLIILIGTVYGLTLGPDYTWKHWGSDGGDLIASIYTLGIPHPPGTPFYVLLLQPFRLIPFGPPAFKTNLASAIFAVLAVVVLAKTVMVLTKNNWLAALVSGLYLALSPTFWSQAVITEVLSLHALLTSLVIYLLIKWQLEKKTRSWYLAFFFLGLSLANHTTSLMLLPAVGYLFLSHLEISAKSFKRLLISGLFLILGLSPYLYLPIRARAQPPLNWGRPDNLSRFVAHVTGQEYHHMLFYQNPFLVIDAGIKFMSSLARNLTYPGLLLAAAGLVLSRQRKPLIVFTGFVFLFQALFVSEYKIPNIETFNLTAFWVTSLWIGLGVFVLNNLLDQFRPSLKKKIPILFVSLERPSFLGGGQIDYPLADLLLSLPLVFFILVPLWQARQYWSFIEVGQEPEAAGYGREIFENLPPGSIIFSEGDRFSLALDYQRWAVHPERDDVAVIVNGLFLQDWRLENYRHLYPQVVFPDRPATQDSDEAFDYLLEMIELNIDKHPIFLTLDYPPPRSGLSHRLTMNDWLLESQGPIYRVIGKLSQIE